MGFKAFIKAFLGLFLGHFNGLFVKFWGINSEILFLDCYTEGKYVNQLKNNRTFFGFLYSGDLETCDVFCWRLFQLISQWCKVTFGYLLCYGALMLLTFCEIWEEC